MKNKIMFAGFMGAILMSVGAANAATTSIATKGYVDSKVGTVQESVTTLQENSITAKDVADAIDTKVTALNLDTTYEVLANKVSNITGALTEEQRTRGYPTVAAVLAAMPTLTDAEKEAISKLTQEGGLADLQTSVAGLETKMDGGADVTGSVASKIADAINTHTTTANDTYQAKSTANYTMGTEAGGWYPLSDAEQKALKSGITVEKVADYDVLNGDAATPGSVANLKQTVDNMTATGGAITTLRGDVDALESTVGTDDTQGLRKKIADNTTNIAANTAALADKISMPKACASGNKTCVLMIADGVLSWTPVTDPVPDSATPSPTAE